MEKLLTDLKNLMCVWNDTYPGTKAIVIIALILTVKLIMCLTGFISHMI